MTYPSTPYLRRMTDANGWRGELIRDARRPYAIVALRVGATWTDAVVIEGEDRCAAMRYRTRGDSELIVPSELGWRREGPGLVAELPGEVGAVWCRDGRCDDVLAELFELPSP